MTEEQALERARLIGAELVGKLSACQPAGAGRADVMVSAYAKACSPAYVSGRLAGHYEDSYPVVVVTIVKQAASAETVHAMHCVVAMERLRYSAETIGLVIA